MSWYHIKFCEFRSFWIQSKKKKIEVEDWDNRCFLHYFWKKQWPCLWKFCCKPQRTQSLLNQDLVLMKHFLVFNCKRRTLPNVLSQLSRWQSYVLLFSFVLWTTELSSSNVVLFYCNLWEWLHCVSSQIVNIRSAICSSNITVKKQSPHKNIVK